MARFVIALTLLVGPLFGATIFAAGPEDKLPASASLVLLLDKPNEAAAKWEKTALGSLFGGKDFAPLYAELQKGEISAPLNPKPALGLDWADIGKFKEPAALAIMEGEVKRSALVFLAGGKGDAAEIKRMLVDAEKYFDGRKAKRLVKKVAGGESISYELAAAAGKEAKICVHVTKGDLFAATNSAAAADKLLKAWEAGDKGSLSSDAEFKKVDSQSRKMAGEKAADIRWFIRPLPLAELLQKKPDPKEKVGRNWVEIARRQGVKAVSSIGGVIALQPDMSHDIEVASLIVAKRPFEKGMRLAEMKPGKPIPPPAWIEAGVGSYINWDWDFAAALDGAGVWVDENMNDPGLFNATLENLAIDGGVSVRLDILPRLGPGIFEVADSHRTKDPANPTGFRLLLGVQSKDQAKLALKMPGLTRDEKVIVDEVVAGSNVRRAPEGEPLFTEPDPKVPKNFKAVQAYGIMPTMSLFSTDFAWLKSKLKAEKVKPLTEDPAYKTVALWSTKQETKSTCLRGFMRSDQSWEIDYDAVREGTVGPKSRLRAQALRYMLLGDSPTKAIAATLPKFEALAPNLLPSGVSMAVSPDGFEFRAVVLRKE